MAIRIECYGLITQSRIGKQYFPKQYADEWCWNDGAICNPMSAMNRLDMAAIVEDCMKLGLEKYKEENGERTIGDFYVATQFGLDDTLNMKNDWLRAYQGVAWNPACPMGIGLPDKFPCWHGGFHYESAEEWETAKLALSAFNDALNKHFSECRSQETGLNPFGLPPFPDATPYDDFFARLGQKSWCHERRLYYKV